MNFLLSIAISVSLVMQPLFLAYDSELENLCVHEHTCNYFQVAHIVLLPDYQEQFLSEILVNNTNRNENFNSLTQKDKKMEQFNNNFENPNIGNFANQVSGNARLQSKQENYVYEQTQDLASAADQIQKLLKQLEKDNPAATDIEKVSYVTEKTDAPFKRRFIKALAAGGESALEEYLVDSSYVRIIRAMVSAWLKTN